MFPPLVAIIHFCRKTIDPHYSAFFCCFFLMSHIVARYQRKESEYILQ